MFLNDGDDFEDILAEELGRGISFKTKGKVKLSSRSGAKASGTVRLGGSKKKKKKSKPKKKSKSKRPSSKRRTTAKAAPRKKLSWTPRSGGKPLIFSAVSAQRKSAARGKPISRGATSRLANILGSARSVQALKSKIAGKVREVRPAELEVVRPVSLRRESGACVPTPGVREPHLLAVITKQLARAANQRLATSEHNTISDQEGYRERVLRQLDEIEQKLEHCDEPTRRATRARVALIFGPRAVA